MGIGVEAPRGGLAEKLAGTRRILILTNAEIERFEDRHRGIFSLWDGFYSRGPKPNNREVRDLVALGLIGAGVSDEVADALVADLGPDHNLVLYQMAQALVGVAFEPDAVDTEDATDGEKDAEKKTGPELGT